MSNTYWHFIRRDCCLGHDDGRQVVVGETLTHDGKLEMCQSGLHASSNIMDALCYAPGPVICCVEMRGQVIKGNDKAIASERYCKWMLTADQSEQVLKHFARWCALQVVHFWDAPQVVTDYLLTGDESIWEAARAAAWEAAREAAWEATWEAAREAARATIRAAVRAAQSHKLVELATIMHETGTLPTMQMPKNNTKGTTSR